MIMVAAVLAATPAAAKNTWTTPYPGVRHLFRTTATAGLSRDGRTLYMAVVDGRTDISDGMKCTELGALTAGLGAWNALRWALMV